MIDIAHAVTEMATTTVADEEGAPALARPIATVGMTAIEIVGIVIETTAADAMMIDGSPRTTRPPSPRRMNVTDGLSLFSSLRHDCVPAN